jgi:hypothetical protein
MTHLTNLTVFLAWRNFMKKKKESEEGGFEFVSDSSPEE